MNNLQSLHSIRKKYTFEEYNSVYPELFNAEKERLEKFLSDFEYQIHHFGSTSIPGLGGKGVIDIYIAAGKDKLKNISEVLQKSAGYEFRKSGGDENRLFLHKEINGRRYHIHLTSFNNPDLEQALTFRDFLVKNPRLAKEYSDIKRVAAKEAVKEDTKESISKKYSEIKDPVLFKILNQIEIH